jgi:hypothetical protein
MHELVKRESQFVIALFAHHHDLRTLDLRVWGERHSARQYKETEHYRDDASISESSGADAKRLLE